MSTKRLVLVVGSIVSVLLVVVIVVGIVILNTMNAQAREREYRDCMARYGFAADEHVPGTTDTDTYIESITEAAEACSTKR